MDCLRCGPETALGRVCSQRDPDEALLHSTTRLFWSREFPAARKLHIFPSEAGFMTKFTQTEPHISLLTSVLLASAMPC